MRFYRNSETPTMRKHNRYAKIQTENAVDKISNKK